MLFERVVGIELFLLNFSALWDVLAFIDALTESHNRVAAQKRDLTGKDTPGRTVCAVLVAEDNPRSYGSSRKCSRVTVTKRIDRR